MGMITRVGNWLDRKFPAKMTVQEVESHFTSFRYQLTELRSQLESVNSLLTLRAEHQALREELMLVKVDLTKVNSELVKIKAERAARMQATPPGSWNRG